MSIFWDFFFWFVFFLSILLLHLLRVHSCLGFVCSFASFVDFLFFFWKVSCEKGFSPFLILIFALGAKCQNVFLSPLVGRGYIPCRIGKDGGFIRRDRSFHLTKDQPSERWAMRDRYPLVKISCLCGCPQGNRFGTISSSNLQG